MLRFKWIRYLNTFPGYAARLQASVSDIPRFFGLCRQSEFELCLRVLHFTFKSLPLLFALPEYLPWLMLAAWIHAWVQAERIV